MHEVKPEANIVIIISHRICLPTFTSTIAGRCAHTNLSAIVPSIVATQRKYFDGKIAFGENAKKLFSNSVHCGVWTRSSMSLYAVCACLSICGHYTYSLTMSPNVVTAIGI